jgi:6-phosphogluconolactonase
MEDIRTSRVYAGTYANADSESIFLYLLNSQTGELHLEKSFKGGAKTSYMAFDRQRHYLYVVNELESFEEKESGAVCAFAVDGQTGFLSLLNRLPSLGSEPVHISIGPRDTTALVANYKSGTVVLFPIQQNGRLAEASALRQHQGSGPNKDRQASAHAHYLAFSPDKQFVFVVDLGIDKVLRYRLNKDEGELTPTRQPVAFSASAGTGPRQLSFHPNGRYAYLIHELVSMITALTYDSERRSFSEIHTVNTIPEDFTSLNKCGGIRVSPDGRYLYGSNRGHNSIVVYSIEKSSGKLHHVETVASGGDWPREFSIDLTGNILLVANQRSNTICTFKIDTTTGKLSATGHQVAVEQPVFIQVVPAIKAEHTSC